jgi:CBS-domain-containing membrane protein
MIQKPITLTVDKKVRDAVELMSRFHISGIPIVDDSMKLIGIFSVFFLLLLSTVCFAQRTLNWPNDTLNVFRTTIHKNSIVQVTKYSEYAAAVTAIPATSTCVIMPYASPPQMLFWYSKAHQGEIRMIIAGAAD